MEYRIKSKNIFINEYIFEGLVMLTTLLRYWQMDVFLKLQNDTTTAILNSE